MKFKLDITCPNCNNNLRIHSKPNIIHKKMIPKNIYDFGKISTIDALKAKAEPFMSNQDILHKFLNRANLK